MTIILNIKMMTIILAGYLGWSKNWYDIGGGWGGGMNRSRLGVWGGLESWYLDYIGNQSQQPLSKPLAWIRAAI